MSQNALNSGSFIGNLARDPFVNENKDGSVSYRFRVLSKNNFRSTVNGVKDYHSAAAEFTAFVPKGASQGIFASLRTGDQVAVSYHLDTDTYTDRSGKTVYAQVAKLDDLTLLTRGKAATAAREQASTEASAAQAEPIQAPDVAVSEAPVE